MIQRIMASYASPSPSSTVGSLAETRLGAEQLGHPDCRDLRAGRWPFGQNGLSSVDVLDNDALPDEGERFGADVRPGITISLVEHSGVGNDRLLPRGTANRGSLDVEPLDRLRGQGDATEVCARDLLDRGRPARLFLPGGRPSAPRNPQRADRPCHWYP